MTLVFQRWPEDEEELWWWVRAVWGVTIPRVRVCPGHCSPWDAFVDAFWARSHVAIWKASRGFGGKSFLLGTLALTEAVILGADVNVLGGSAAQSLNVHEHTQALWESPNAPKGLLDGQPRQYETRLVNRARIRALMASQRSVRGPHPQRLRLDEIDEMDLSILEAAQGQPMRRKGIEAHTVMSSTHQYPDRCMSIMLQRAADKGWPVWTWCWRESVGTAEEPGWLELESVQRKRAEVGETFWAVEYDLQEPSFEGRAFTTMDVDLFCQGLVVQDTPGVELIFEQPVHRNYTTGVDWAKEKDWTVITTWDTSSRPWRLVAWERTQRESWPDMVAKVVDRVTRYPGVLVHDSTGLGNVVDDLIPRNLPGVRVMPVVLTGRGREILFNEWIAAVEQHEAIAPRIQFLWSEHLYCVRDDLFGKGHPPDSVVSCALAWSARNTRVVVHPPAELTRVSPWDQGQRLSQVGSYVPPTWDIPVS